MARISDFINRQTQQPANQEIGIAGFTALARVSESYKLTCEVPDQPVENGSFLNDHIILKPLTITIKGEVADVFLRPDPAVREFRRLQAEVGNVTSQYAPLYTQSQLSQISALVNDAADAERRANNLLDTGGQLFDYFGNRDSESLTLREQFLGQMEALYYGRQVIEIDMPYRRLDSMVITSFISDTDNETDTIVFTIEARQIVTAELVFVEVETPAEGVGGQLSEQVSKGTQEGKPVTESLLTQIKDAAGGLYSDLLGGLTGG